MTTNFTEGGHAAEFILNEQPGHLSRENITIAESQTILPGSIIFGGVGGYTAYGAGDESPSPGATIGISIYGVTTGSGETAQVAAIVRLAEVNGKCLAWPTGFTHDQMTLAAAALAANDVIVRGFPI